MAYCYSRLQKNKLNLVKVSLFLDLIFLLVPVFLSEDNTNSTKNAIHLDINEKILAVIHLSLHTEYVVAAVVPPPPVQLVWKNLPLSASILSYVCAPKKSR